MNPPKPVEVRRREGNPGHRALAMPSLVGGRVTIEDLKALPVPANMSPAERKAWREIIGPLVQGGVLDRADLTMVEMAAVALARAREARVTLADEGITHRGSQGLSMHPAITVEKGAMAEYRQMANLLGMGPSGRTKLGRTAAAKPDGGMGGELGRVLPKAARFRVVNGDDD